VKHILIINVPLQVQNVSIIFLASKSTIYNPIHQIAQNERGVAPDLSFHLGVGRYAHAPTKCLLAASKQTFSYWSKGREAKHRKQVDLSRCPLTVVNATVKRIG
jgi:hypothetical protein